MAIQNRRGVYIDFDASKMVAGEFAVVQSGDPDSSNGTSLYISFQSGTAKRIILADDLDGIIGSLDDLETTDKTSIVNAINEISEKATIYHGVTSTSGATRDKVVVCSDFELKDGVYIAVDFSQNNTATNARLDVNNTGAKSIVASENSYVTDWIIRGSTYLFRFEDDALGGAYYLIGATERIPSDSTPIMDGTAASGTSKQYARADHVHPTDTSRASMEDLTAEETAREAADDAINAELATKADADGVIASAEQLLSDKYTVDQVPYLFRPSGGSGADREIDQIVGGSIVWNQLCNGSSVTVPNGRKYYMVKGGTASIGASTGTAITGLTSGTDMVTDLTQAFGSTIADYIYSLEQATAGAGVAWFKKLFPKDYYAYDAGTMMHVSDLQSHDMVGFNAYNPETGKAKVVGGNVYQITGTYTALSLNGTTITPDSSGYFTPDTNGEMVVTGGNSTDTCVHLKWDGEWDGEYEPYEKHSYPLDDSLTLRGIPKLDASNNLYYDGDTYAADGTVTRKYGVVTLNGSSQENWIKSSSYPGGYYWGEWVNTHSINGSINHVQNNNLATVTGGIAEYSQKTNVVYFDGSLNIKLDQEMYPTIESFRNYLQTTPVIIVYELKTPTTEEAEPYNKVQIVEDFGTEEYVTTSLVPVGHYTKYPANLRSAIERVMEQVPEAPSANGTYVLKATKTSNGVTYAWTAE